MIRLLRRDLPLEPGRKLRFTFTLDYEVTLDQNVLDYPSIDPADGGDPQLESSSLEEIERRLGGLQSEELLKCVRDYYDLGLVEHEVTLSDLDAGDGSEVPPRFETAWEAESRRRGDSWLTREWLDEIPPPRSEASDPKQTKRVIRVQIDG